MKGNCKLCNDTTELQLSHIVPKSIYKWIKNTSATGILRGTKNINKPIQDGQKEYMLCSSCEKKFSIYEKYFIEKIFKPVNKISFAKTFYYNEKLFYFLSSIWWRLIVHSLSEIDVQESIFLNKIIECEVELREFLLDYKYPLNFDKNYLLLLGEVKEAPKEMENLNFIFLRTVDPLLMFSDESCFVSLRIPKFYFFLNIDGLNASELKNHAIMPSDGTYNVPQETLGEENICSFVQQRIEVFNERLNLKSENQVKKTTERHLKQHDKFLKSKSYEAWINDRIRESKKNF